MLSSIAPEIHLLVERLDTIHPERHEEGGRWRIGNHDDNVVDTLRKQLPQNVHRETLIVEVRSG